MEIKDNSKILFKLNSEVKSQLIEYYIEILKSFDNKSKYSKCINIFIPNTLVKVEDEIILLTGSFIDDYYTGKILTGENEGEFKIIEEDLSVEHLVLHSKYSKYSDIRYKDIMIDKGFKIVIKNLNQYNTVFNNRFKQSELEIFNNILVGIKEIHQDYVKKSNTQ